MIVCALDDERILGVNDAGSSITATAAPNSESSPSPASGLRIRTAVGRRPPAGRKTGEPGSIQGRRTLIDLASISRHLVYGDQPAVLLALMDITERKRAEARLAFMAQHDGLTGLPNRNCCASKWMRSAAHAAQHGEGFGAGTRPRQLQGGHDTLATASATSCCAGSPNACAPPGCREEDALPVSTLTIRDVQAG